MQGKTLQEHLIAVLYVPVKAEVHITGLQPGIISPGIQDQGLQVHLNIIEAVQAVRKQGQGTQGLQQPTGVLIQDLLQAVEVHIQGLLLQEVIPIIVLQVVQETVTADQAQAVQGAAIADQAQAAEAEAIAHLQGVREAAVIAHLQEAQEAQAAIADHQAAAHVAAVTAAPQAVLQGAVALEAAARDHQAAVVEVEDNNLQFNIYRSRCQRDLF